MEIIDMHKELEGKPTMFSHLVLDVGSDNLTPVVKVEGYDIRNVQVELRLNGHPVRVEEFNNVMEDWAERIGDSIKKELEYHKNKEAVVEKAKELLDNKMGEVYDFLNRVDWNKWMLED